MRTLRKYAVIARVHLQNALAYRASVASRLCFYTLFIFVFMNLWRAIYREGDVHGYTLPQIIWYLVVTELVMFGCNTGVYGQMNEDVRSGAIAYQLNRPVHYLLYHFAGAVGHMAINLTFFGAAAVALGLAFAGPLTGFRAAMLPFWLLSLGMGVSLSYFFHMLIGLSAFVLEDNVAFYLIYQKLVFMLGGFLPVEFLPEWLQVIARNLPFSYVAWAPARLFVDFSWPLFWQLVPRQAMWLALCVALTFTCYRGGARRLEVNGG